MKKRITAEQLRGVLDYDPITGVFKWRRKTNRRIRVGAIAGCDGGKGYITIGVCGIQYEAQRLVYLYMTGEWPSEEIDHKNGVRSDNRWENLRDVARILNSQNQRFSHRDSAVGLLGVSKADQRLGFRARIKVNGKERHIGTFNTSEAAHAAYVNSKRLLHEGGTI